MKALSERAVMVRLSISFWAGRKLDRRVTARVTDLCGAASDAGRWNKWLVPKAYREDMEAAMIHAREVFYRFTLPWDDAGTRIMPIAHFDKFSAGMRKYHDAFDKAVVEFVRAYPQVLTDAENRMGETFDINDYPAVETVKAKYAFNVDIHPVPDSRDFRIDIDKDRLSELGQRIDSQVQERVAAATKDLWIRLHECLSKIVDRLSGGKKIFRNSLIGNLRELVAILPALNLAGDKGLAEMVTRLNDGLAKFDPEVLRNSDKHRGAASDEAKKVLAKMAGYVGK